jgi:hypothetical protein
MPENQSDVPAALKLQRDNRARARARQAALQRLKDAHPEEYSRYYSEERQRSQEDAQ